MVTAAFGTTAPGGPVMVPWTVPTLWLHASTVIHSNKKKTITLSCMTACPCIKTDETEQQMSVGSGNYRGRPNDMGPDQIDGASNGIGNNGSGGRMLGRVRDDGSGQSRRTMADHAHRAIPCL